MTKIGRVGFAETRLIIFLSLLVAWCYITMSSRVAAGWYQRGNPSELILLLCTWTQE
jgi:hypothetical protein